MYFISQNCNQTKVYAKRGVIDTKPFLMVLVSLFALTSGCEYFKKYEVETTPVILHPISFKTDGNSSSFESNLTFLLQASGWIEPDPYPIRIPSLYEGIVRDVYVLEGEMVKKGQKLVSLIDDDARLALQHALAELSQAQAKELEVASELSLQKLSLQKAQLEKLKEEVLLKEQEDYLTRLESLPDGAVRTFDINKSRYETIGMKFSYDASDVDVEIAQKRIDLISQKLQSLKKKTNVMTIQVKQAKLDLNRTEIFSPITGRVLLLNAKPGQRLMQKMDSPEASTALIIYKEENLQARIDVPLADTSKLFLGQKVKISCSMLPDKIFHGRLTRISGEADLQRNTLQVKVRILNPDSRLRPEMICRAKFYPQSNNQSSSQNSGNLGLFIPLGLQPSEKSNPRLWIIARDGKTAELREINVGKEIVNGYIRVASGLQAGDQIITNPPRSLKSGDKVRISGKK